MSRESLELATRAMRAVARRPPDFETVNELFHPDHVLVSIPAAMLGEGEARGARGYKDWFEQFSEAMPFEMDVEGAVDVAADTVLMVSTVRMQGVVSGVAGDQRIWSVVKVAEGRVVRTQVFLDPATAIADATR